MANFKHIFSYLASATLVLVAVMVFHAVPVAYAHGGGSHYGNGCESCDYVPPVDCDCNYTQPTIPDCGSCGYIPPTNDCGSCNYVPPVNCDCNYTPPAPTPTPVTLTATCTANPSSVNVGDSITWSAQATGGSGSYTYSWSGAAYGSGQTQSLFYNVAGTKSATVTVHSGDQSVTANCQGYVNNNNVYYPPYYPPTNQNLSAYCYATPGTVNIGNRVDWYASASGGNGNYSYTWSGSNIINNGQSAYAVYQNPGTQNAYVTVYSNGQSVSVNCSVIVNSVGSVTINQNPTGNLSSGVYLSTVPYTGAGPNWKISLFVLGLVMWSAFMAFMILKKNGSLAVVSGSVSSMTERIEQFKRDNIARKNS